MIKFISEFAWRFILEQNICKLPIDPQCLASQNNWIIYTYEQLSKRIDIPVSEIIAKYDHDGFVFCSEKDNTYVICYNEAMPICVSRWTLLHEIGHIYLKHVNLKKPLLPRIRSEQRPFFEAEAQGFARRVLCPSIVLHSCTAFEPEEIMRLCGIGWEAAGYRSKYIKELEVRGKFFTNPLEREVAKQFAPFIRQYNLNKSRETKNNFLYKFATALTA